MFDRLADDQPAGIAPSEPRPQMGPFSFLRRMCQAAVEQATNTVHMMTMYSSREQIQRHGRDAQPCCAARQHSARRPPNQATSGAEFAAGPNHDNMWPLQVQQRGHSGRHYRQHQWELSRPIRVAELVSDALAQFVAAQQKAGRQARWVTPETTRAGSWEVVIAQEVRRCE